MKTVYSLNDKDYFECGSGNVLKIKRIVNIVMEEQKLNENKDKDFFTLYVGTKEEFFPNIFVDDIIEDLKQQAFQEIDDENFLSDIEEDEKQELSKKLNDCLKTFIKKHCLQSTRFYVKNIKKYLVSYDKKIIRELKYEAKN